MALSLGACYSGDGSDPEGDSGVALGVSHAELENLLDEYAGRGMALRAISVQGGLDRQTYSVAWGERPLSPDLQPFHGLGLAEFGQLERKSLEQGRVLKLLSVAGAGKNVVLAGAFGKTDEPETWSRLMLDLDEGSAWRELNLARNAGLIPAQLRVYGTEGEPRYAVSFRPNRENTPWNAVLRDSASDLRARYDAEALQWARPFIVSASGFGIYASVFVDMQIEGGHAFFSELTRRELLNEAHALAESRHEILELASTGEGSETRWTALWGASERPVPKALSVEGSAVPELRELDEWVLDKLVTTGARAASLAIAKDGRLLYGKGFTYAEADYPRITPTSLFRIASLSKPVTSVAIHQAIQAGRLALDDKVGEILELKDPTGAEPKDPRMADQRVWHLLSHSTGWDRSIRSDLPDPWVVKESFGKEFPITKLEWLRGKLAEDLQFTPGTKVAYSNLGYMVLGLILEKKFPELGSYENIVRTNILSRLGLKRPRISPSRAEDQLPGMVRLQDPTLSIYETMVDSSGTWVPITYGYEDFRIFDSFGGWLFSTVDYVKVLAELNGEGNRLLDAERMRVMWEAPIPDAPYVRRGVFGWTSYSPGGKVVNAVNHGGSLVGSTTLMARREDGYSVALFFNRTDVPCGDLFDQVNGFLSDLPETPKGDFFSKYGL